ncbi:2-dehydro-3-deoxygalactonokinase [uncultured Ruegeria sp.]|uniref:2-dehydro-3-deoxygalactonokinase n=1 Tax=uncultured Ruegeria sp. TaxID=259304 RepID=UPI002639BD02|nr:2-dehydro-3-deoxygalactonokinase [uncultured Ruegeria sp.]
MGDVNALEFVGVDWGTSSFRAWLCEAESLPQQIHNSDQGMSRLNQDEFAPYLVQVLHDAGIEQTVPVIICGMAGARDGWHEVPYVALPATWKKIQRNAVQLRAGPYHCFILPGVCLSMDGRFDVMRGEETLLFGALSSGAPDGVFCLPGTHSKWCRIEDGKLVNWQTMMTGELFALLSTQSTLSKFCSNAQARFRDDPAFECAVQEALSAPNSAIHKLFSIRARALLDPDVDHREFPSRLSGLLIGQEIAGIELDRTEPVILIAGGDVREAYDCALRLAGFEVIAIDPATSSVAGLSLFAAGAQ